MKKILGLMSLLLLVSACSNNSEIQAVVHKISAEEAKEKMSEANVVIVDVRTQEEYEVGHIENSLLIPNESIVDNPQELDDLDATILVYCRSGNRSAQAAKKLVELGYTQVYDFGGIIDWPFEIVQ